MSGYDLSEVWSFFWKRLLLSLLALGVAAAFNTGFAVADDELVPPERGAPVLAPLLEGASPWKAVETGLDLGTFPAMTVSGRAFEIIMLRINPAFFDFFLCAASADGEKLRSLREWAGSQDLVAAINAGMYLPDGVTNTGYLRVGEHLNNPRLVSRFGAFFMAGPQSPDLPSAVLLDRTEDPWEEQLTKYSMVVQNYRFISASRRLLWQPGGPEHAIAAVGRDSEGNILFILCREPLTGADLGTLLLAMPVSIRLVMYVEGGSQAALYLRVPDGERLWMGRHPADFWTTGNPNAPLPNIIGVRRKAQP